MKVPPPLCFVMVLTWICNGSPLLRLATKVRGRLGPGIFKQLSFASSSERRCRNNVNTREYEVRSSRISSTGQQSNPPKQLGKRKMTVVCGYVGSNYRGLQIDTSDNAFSTVEGEMIKALVASGFVSESNAVDLSKIGWSRSSRTDKGVHASRIVLSMKLVVDNNFNQKIHSQQYADRINEHLQDDIRVFSVTKVNQGFRAREAGSWREYDYVLPLSMIGGKLEEFDNLLRNFEGSKSFHNFHRVQRKNLRGIRLSEEIVNDNVDDDEDEEEIFLREARKQNRIKRWEQGLITSVFEDWKETERPQGVFTRKNIYACRVVDVMSMKGVEMVRVKIKGQSFLLHQIRLMIGAAIMVCANKMPEAALNAALMTPYFIAFPMAPGNGLILRNAGFGMNCNKVDYAMTKDDALESQIDNFLLLENQVIKSNEFLVDKIYDRVHTEWTESDMKLSQQWLEYNTERYYVDENLKYKFENLANEGKIQHETYLEKVRQRDLNTSRTYMENGLDRKEFVSEFLSHKIMLPPSTATEIAIKMNTVPSKALTKALKYLALEVIEGKLAHGVTIDEISTILKDIHGIKCYAEKYDLIYNEVMSTIKEKKNQNRKNKKRKEQKDSVVHDANVKS